MDALVNPDLWISLLTLTLLEVVLGIDNLICVLAEPTLETANSLFAHRDIAMICVTGGPAVVKSLPPFRSLRSSDSEPERDLRKMLAWAVIAPMAITCFKRMFMDFSSLFYSYHKQKVMQLFAALTRLEFLLRCSPTH